MQKSFNWRHVLTLAVLVGLLSLAAGAVLSQEEPGLPEPEVPTFDITGPSADAEAEPAEPDVVEPLTVIPVDPAAAETQEFTGIMPADGSVVSELPPMFDWDDVEGAEYYIFNLYGSNQIDRRFDGEGNPVGFAPGFLASPLTSTRLSTPGGLTYTEASLPSSLNVTAETAEEIFEDGLRYLWEVTAYDADDMPIENSGTVTTVPGFFGGSFDIVTYPTFIVDLPILSPAEGESVFSTTPQITWPEVEGVAWYLVAAYNEEEDILGALDWYPADDNTIYEAPYNEGVCENGQCKVRPRTEIDLDIDDGRFLIGDSEIDIWVEFYDANFDVVTPFTNITSFNLIAPDPAVDVEAGATEGRPAYTIPERNNIEVDELPGQGLLGMTMTVAPDFYQVYAFARDDVDFVDSENEEWVEEWFTVSNTFGGEECFDNEGETAPCELRPYDSEQDILYNGTYDYYVRGYSSQLDGYTPYVYGGTFVIDEEAPAAEEIFIAGVYEQIGNNGPYSPRPFAMTGTWVPCGDQESGVQANGDVTCDTSRPLVHFALDVGEDAFSGDWVNIIAFDNAPNGDGVVFEQWFNTNDGEFSRDGNYFYCDEGFGQRADSSLTPTFPGRSCFFQTAEIGGDVDEGYSEDFFGFEKGGSYTWYIASYGPGGFSTGGLQDIGYTDPDAMEDANGNSFADFSIAAADAVTNLRVDIEGEPTPLTYTGSSGDEFPYNGLTETLITGEPRISWDWVPGATYYYVEIGQGEDVFFSEWLQPNISFDGNRINCDPGPQRCGFTPGGEFFLDNGTYNVIVAYWDGGVSADATVNFTIANEAPEAPGSMTNTMIVFEDENLTGVTRPVFQWPHVDNATWYHIELTDSAGNTVLPDDFNNWQRAYNICNLNFIENVFDDDTGSFLYSEYNTLCNYVVEQDFDLILDPGTYNWTVIAFSPSFDIVESDAAEFTIDGTSTGTPTALYPTSEYSPLTWTNTPTFYFEAGENASWYLIFVGENDGGEYIPYAFDWYYRPYDERPEGYFGNPAGDFYCRDEFGSIYAGPTPNDPNPFNSGKQIELEDETVVCQLPYNRFGGSDFYNEALLENGNYEWWVLTYGPNGFANNGDYLQLTTFEVDIPATEPVDMTPGFFGSVFPRNGGIYTSINSLSWPSVQFAQWYYVEVKDTADDSVIVGEWYFYEDVNNSCSQQFAGSTCRVSVDDELFSPYAVFEYSVATWGQGNDLSGDFFGATFPEEPAVFTKL